MAVRKLLIKNGGVPFHLLKLDADEDEYLKSQQKNMKDRHQGLDLNWVDEAFGDKKTSKKKTAKKPYAKKTSKKK